MQSLIQSNPLVKKQKVGSMYHEERVIEGVLHYRTTPNGKWTAYTLQELTEKVQKETSVKVQAGQQA